MTRADLVRCQAEVPNGYTFITLGGRPGRERCPNEAVEVAYENDPGPDGKRGCMSLCARCKGELLKKFPDTAFEFVQVEKTSQFAWGMACPDCGRDDLLTVDVSVSARLGADGTEIEGDHLWDDGSGCRCDCGWHGEVGATESKAES